MKYLTRPFFYGLCPLVKLLLGFLGWERAGSFWTCHCLWDLSIQNRISRWETTKRLLCGKLQWWTLPWDGHIFVRTFSVGLKIFLLWMGWGEIRTCITCCLRDIKVMETAKQSSIYKQAPDTNQKSCKCLRDALTIQWLEGQYLERCMVWS